MSPVTRARKARIFGLSLGSGRVTRCRLCQPIDGWLETFFDKSGRSLNDPIADIRRIADADVHETRALAGGEMNLAVIPAVLALMRAHFDRRAGRISKAKSRIEAILMNYPDVFEFLDAYHGFMLITERDIDNAHKSFNSNLRKLPEKKNDNQRYIELYCRYFLDAGKEDFDWKSLIAETERLTPDSLTKRLLVLPTWDRILATE